MRRLCVAILACYLVESLAFAPAAALRSNVAIPTSGTLISGARGGAHYLAGGAGFGGKLSTFNDAGLSGEMQGRGAMRHSLGHGAGARRRRRSEGVRGVAALSGQEAADATLSALSVWLPDPVVRDVACTLGGTVGAVGWLGVWTWLAQKGLVDSKVSRKVVHCGSGPLFLLTWPLFSNTYLTRAIASIVPATNALRLLKAGTSSGEKGKDSGLVSAISRSGNPAEVLQGPFVYTLVLLASTAGGWLTIPAISAVCQMAAGDGMADLVGRRWGTVKWPWSETKSVAGSAAFFVAAFLATLGEIAWFHAFGSLAISPEECVGRVAIISAACALVELIPLQRFLGIVGDDNFSVPIVGAGLAMLLFL